MPAGLLLAGRPGASMLIQGGELVAGAGCGRHDLRSGGAGVVYWGHLALEAALLGARPGGTGAKAGLQGGVPGAGTPGCNLNRQPRGRDSLPPAHFEPGRCLGLTLE